MPTHSSSQQQLGAQLADSPVLPLLLQHPSVAQQQEVICKLLCVSHTLRAAVADHCSGQLRPAMEDDDILQSASSPPPAWIFKHGALLHSLAVQLEWRVMQSWCLTQDGMDSSTAAALQAAAEAAGPAGLKLTYVDCQANGYPAVLKQLPSVCAAHLTCLKTGGTCGNDISAAIGRLTALRELQAGWYTNEEGGLELYTSALAGLQHLTLLNTWWDKQQLPTLAQLRTPQLRQLTLTMYDNDEEYVFEPRRDSGNFLKLPALTALTSFKSEGLVLQDGDELPVSLQQLEICDVCDVGPLLQLRQLCDLRLLDCKLTTQQLLRLGCSCSNLQLVQLSYRCDALVAARAAAAWGIVQLKELAITLTSSSDAPAAEPRDLAATIVNALGKCSRLTGLYLGLGSGMGHDMDFGSTPNQLAGALQQLTALQHLDLHIIRWASIEHGFAALARSIGSLTALHSLTLDCMPVDGGNAAFLSALPGLTRLDLQHLSSGSQGAVGQPGSTAAAYGATWSQLVASLGCLSNLRNLQLTSCGGLAAVDGLEQQWQSLCKLTHISLCGCGLVDKCVDCFAKHSTGLASLTLQHWAPLVEGDPFDEHNALSLVEGDPGCITDASMFAVAEQLKCLTELRILGASVTDAGLQAVCAQACLRSLFLGKCAGVTQFGLHACQAEREHPGMRWLEVWYQAGTMHGCTTHYLVL